MSAERQWPDAAMLTDREWEDVLAALHELRQRRGVEAGRRMEPLIDRVEGARAAQPVVALPPCPTCEGSGDQVQYALTADGAAEDIHRDCPACNGSRVDRMVPCAALRAWIEEYRAFPPPDTAHSKHSGWVLDDLSVFLASLHAEPGTDRSER